MQQLKPRRAACGAGGVMAGWLRTCKNSLFDRAGERVLSWSLNSGAQSNRVKRIRPTLLAYELVSLYDADVYRAQYRLRSVTHTKFFQY